LVCSACLRRGLLASTSRTVRAMPKMLSTRVTVIPLGWSDVTLAAAALPVWRPRLLARKSHE
jgi:hypothetical protein